MPQNTFFDLLKHFLVTSVVTFFLWFKYRNPKLIIIAYLMGVLIDVDHFFDYLYYVVLKFGFWGIWHLNFSDFFDPSVYVKSTDKVFVFLHGWEYLVVLWFFAQKLKKKIPGIHFALLIPYFFHLLIDQSPFIRAPLAYFFFIRLINNFNLSAFNGH